MIKIDPNSYVEGTLGALAPDLTNPESPHNNPFNVDKNLEFYEVEMTIGEGANSPMPKPKEIKNPGSVPTGFSLGLSEPPVFTQPTITKGVVNDLFPSIEEPVINGAPQPRQSAIDRDFSKTIKALPTYVLGPVDSTLTAEDGPGYSELEFKTKKPATPDPTRDYTWENAENYGFSRKNVEWLTFLYHDKSLENTSYQLSNTQLLDAKSSLQERLTNVELQKSNSVWKNTTEDHLKEIIFAPDLNGSLDWEKMIAYVNCDMVKAYLDPTEPIYIDEGVIHLQGDLSDVPGDLSTPRGYLEQRVREKTSLLLYKDKISAIQSYNVRKVLNVFFTQKTNSDPTVTVAEALCDDLLTIGVSVTLRELQSENLPDDRIKDKISEEISKYIDGKSDTLSLKCIKDIKNIAEQAIDGFVAQNLFEAKDKATTLDAICQEIRDL
ncbi:MAG: hypothetical protein LBB11_03520, partial [Puniceicoccales bacterium]|nr:hypothetical protein [Puniceicoccales bacterium]